MPIYYIDWTYWVFVIPCLIISAVCSIKVKSSFSKYSRVANSRGMTGAQAASFVLRCYGVTGVTIEPVSGSLTDHFDPRTNIIRLSQDVYDKATVAAVGVAAHEAGHAVQHAEGYLPNKIRGLLIPVSNIGSRIGWVLIIIGLFMPAENSVVLSIGLILYSLSVLVTIVTLPVEFNASSRALKCIRENNLLSLEEYDGAKKTLTAAAMTYVASTLTALLQLLRVVLLTRRRRND